MILLLACAPLPGPTRLPHWVSIVAERHGGETQSFLVELRRNARQQIDVRIAEGARLYDGHHVWEIDGSTVRDLVANDARELNMVEPLVALDRNHAWYRRDDVDVACGLDDGRCLPAQMPGLPLEHPGPGAGFRVSVDGKGVLRLGLPADAEGEATPVVAGVTRIIGVHWVRAAEGETVPVIERVFRGRGGLAVERESVVVDGELSEWEGAEPLLVGASWQIESGRSAWEGERDGSYSIAGSWSDELICFAGRVRDDRSTAGDVLGVTAGRHAWEVRLSGPAEPETAIVPELFGLHFEFCRPMPPVARERGRGGLRVVFRDDDGAGLPTELASAPMGSSGPMGIFTLSEAPRSTPPPP